MCSYANQVGVYFPDEVGRVEQYGSLSVRLQSVDVVSHSDIIIRDFVLASVDSSPVSCYCSSLVGSSLCDFFFCGWFE